MKKLTCLILLVLTAASTSYAMEDLWYYTDTDRSNESFFKNAHKIDIFGPQTYYLDYNGEIKGSLRADVLEKARQNNIKIMPLLANITGTLFDQKKIVDLLNNKKNWEKTATFMREEARKNGYYGWQLDLENIPVKQKDNFNSYVKYLKSEFEKDNLKLSVAIVSKISDNPKDYDASYWNNWAGAYDYKVLASSTDFLSIMAYDQPNSPGPVATIQWSKKVLDYSLKNVPKEKISFGIPVYSWAYRSGQKKHFTMIHFPFIYQKITHYDKSDVKNMTTGAGTSKYYGNISWVSYNQWGKNYTIWYEDLNSFKLKYEQIKNAGVLGYSAWVLGDEDPAIWEFLKED